MAWAYHDLAKLPELYEIVGCAWPLDENPDDPGPVVRPCLVVKRTKLTDENGVAYGTVAYGSGQATPAQLKRDLFIGEQEFRAVGLHKPTRFAVDRFEEFIWGPD